uniref:Uncharacterized protein n=1 Tax=Rhabditophanes sp. KR3021 TaxID=114890 RepID=A0AC35U2N4_9BILA
MTELNENSINKVFPVVKCPDHFPAKVIYTSNVNLNMLNVSNFNNTCAFDQCVSISFIAGIIEGRMFGKGFTSEDGFYVILESITQEFFNSITNLYLNIEFSFHYRDLELLEKLKVLNSILAKISLKINLMDKVSLKILFSDQDLSNDDKVVLANSNSTNFEIELLSLFTKFKSNRIKKLEYGSDCTAINILVLKASREFEGSLKENFPNLEKFTMIFNLRWYTMYNYEFGELDGELLLEVLKEINMCELLRLDICVYSVRMLGVVGKINKLFEEKGMRENVRCTLQRLTQFDNLEDLNCQFSNFKLRTYLDHFVHFTSNDTNIQICKSIEVLDIILTSNINEDITFNSDYLSQIKILYFSCYEIAFTERTLNIVKLFISSLPKTITELRFMNLPVTLNDSVQNLKEQFPKMKQLIFYFNNHGAYNTNKTNYSAVFEQLFKI